jgi:hypothetical protein
MNISKDDAFLICFITSLVALIVGFGAAELGIYVNGKNEKIGSGTCPEIITTSNSTLNQNEPITYFELKKDLSFGGLLWRWEYNGPIGSHQIKLKQSCPSLTHDVLMYIDGSLTARTNGKILSTTSTIEVYDCHQNQIYTITTGSFWITLLNTNRIQVSFHLQDIKGNTLLYVAGTNIFTLMTHYSFMDSNGIEVAYADKDVRTFPWTWKVNLRHPESSILDVRVLSLVFAHASFSEGGTNSNGKDTTDSCNGFFFWNGIAWGIFTFLVICILCWIFYESIKQCCRWCRNKDWRSDCGDCLSSCRNLCVKSKVQESPEINVHANIENSHSVGFYNTTLDAPIISPQYQTNYSNIYRTAI